MYEIKIPVTYDLVSDNPYKINPIVRALTWHFFRKKTLQIVFFFNMPIPTRTGEKVFRLYVTDLVYGMKKPQEIIVPENVQAKCAAYKEHGFIKPFTCVFSVTEKVVECIRDWQFYMRIDPPDLGFTDEMKAIPNHNEKAKNHRSRSRNC